MQKTCSETPQNAPMFWQNPTWFQALTLSERIASLQVPAHATSILDIEHARWRLQRWKGQAAFQKGNAFADRLVMDAITEDDLFALLAETAEALQARLSHSPLPGWLLELSQAFADPYTLSDEALPLLEVAGDQPHRQSFLTTVQPLLRRGVERLRKGIHELSLSSPTLSFDVEGVTASLLAYLGKRILNRLGRTLVLELNVARVRERLQGDTPEERFQHFLWRLTQEGEMLAILEEYPVLARHLVEMIDLWVRYGLECLNHLCADWDEICALFTCGSDPGELVAIDAGAGDTHRGGRSVIGLKFRSGFRLIYKPKSLAIDKHFQELIGWLNDCGYSPALRTLKLIDKGGYGWSEFVDASSCTSAEGIERFYERQGAYLALFYALQATDFHYENVIAAGEHPMPIDLEALFHPQYAAFDAREPENPAAKAILHSVLPIGLLPQRLYSHKDASGVDLSGLGGQEGQMSPFALSMWKDSGTDRMRITHQRVEMQRSKNRPKLNGHEVDTLDYRKQIVSGFTTMYRLLMEQREALIARWLPRFAEDEIRVILRSTSSYELLLFGSFHPNLLRDALDRDCLLDRLWLGVGARPYLPRSIPAERADLLRGDIPMFTTRPDALDLFTSQGERIAEFFDEPSIESVKRHVQQLDESDLCKQGWMIEASFTSMFMGTHQVTQHVHNKETRRTGIPVTFERLVAAATAVGDRLCDLALRDEVHTAWLGVVPVNEREWHLLPTGSDLYNGTAGIALFLAYLGAISGGRQYSTVARSAVTTVRREIEVWKKQARCSGVGAFEGLGAVIYLFSHLGTLWNEPALFAEADELVDLLPELIEKDERLDMMSGSAGCIASLLSIYHVTSSKRALETAVRCGQHLMNTAQQMKAGVGWKTVQQKTPLAGFSHGAAGIAFSLLRLAAISGEVCFKHTAMETMAYERSLFSASKQNWPDLRQDSVAEMRQREQAAPETEQRFITTWCHGAPGIGLARLASLPYIDDAVIYEEIDSALKTTIAEGFGSNHSLCHGDLGNLETLLVATQVLADPRYRKELQRHTAMLLDSIETHGWVTGVPLGVETPGLMTGLAGIGYELLRLAQPDRVPSILLLAPPPAGTSSSL